MPEKKRDYILFLEDILSAIEKIEMYTKELKFINSVKTAWLLMLL